MDGLGCNTELVNEIFCTLNNEEIKAMRETYQNKYDSSLGDRLRSELSGEHERLILKLLLAGNTFRIDIFCCIIKFYGLCIRSG